MRITNGEGTAAFEDLCTLLQFVGPARIRQGKVAAAIDATCLGRGDLPKLT